MSNPQNKRVSRGADRASGRRRLFASFLCLVLFMALPFGLLTGCSLPERAAGQDLSGPGDGAARFSIVCTAFPQYDWVRNLLGDAADHVEVKLLNSRGTDMHSFQPTAENMVAIADCDLFIHIGGFSETWVDAALQSAGNGHAQVLTLLDHVDKKEEVITPGMVHDHDHDHDHFSNASDHHDSHHEDAEHHEDTAHHDLSEDHTAEIEYDEHLWLSLRCAQDACQAIADALCRMDPAYTDTYRHNLDTYCSQLQALDARYEAALDHAYTDALEQTEKKPLLFADRFPFRYLTDDYGLTYFAAFPGCSAETEASFETIVFLSEEMAVHQLDAILVLEGSKTDLARTVLLNSGVKSGKILTLNSMQSVTAEQIKGGLTYLSIMEDNLEVLKEALD